MISVAGLIASPCDHDNSASKYGVRAFTMRCVAKCSPRRQSLRHLSRSRRTDVGSHLRRIGCARPLKSSSLAHDIKYVARRVVDVANIHVASSSFPGVYGITAFDTLFPVVVDWILYLFAKKLTSWTNPAFQGRQIGDSHDSSRFDKLNASLRPLTWTPLFESWYLLTISRTPL